MSDRLIKSLFIVLLQGAFLLVGCGNQSVEITENGNAKVATRGSRQVESTLATEISQGKPFQSTLSETAKKEPPRKQSLVELDWGREVDLDEMIAMAMEDQIREIQWHVMPNILRAETPDGEIFHLRNENKGVDLRNTLIDAGVRIGRKGVLFQHVF